MVCLDSSTSSRHCSRRWRKYSSCSGPCTPRPDPGVALARSTAGVAVFVRTTCTFPSAADAARTAGGDRDLAGTRGAAGGRGRHGAPWDLVFAGRRLRRWRRVWRGSTGLGAGPSAGGTALRSGGRTCRAGLQRPVSGVWRQRVSTGFAGRRGRLGFFAGRGLLSGFRLGGFRNRRLWPVSVPGFTDRFRGLRRRLLPRALLRASAPALRPALRRFLGGTAFGGLNGLLGGRGLLRRFLGNNAFPI